jgi:hypothetical protein
VVGRWSVNAGRWSVNADHHRDRAERREDWPSNRLRNITWSASAVANVLLEYSLDGGAAWTTITSSTTAASGTFAWTPPETGTTAALVRVSDTAGAATTSNGTFTIASAGGGPAHLILNEIGANEASHA